MNYLTVFALTFALDVVWAFYNINCSKRQPIKASCAAVAIIALGQPMTIAIVNDHWMLLPAMVGAFGGTYITVRRSRHG